MTKLHSVGYAVRATATFSPWLAANKTVGGLLALVVYVPGQPALIENGADPPLASRPPP